jgi:hypothetical protein
VLLAAFTFPAPAFAQTSQPATAPATPSATRFVTLDVFVELPAGRALAAYQVEWSAASRDVELVGVEGGAHRAFAGAPFYDPAALAKSRVVIGAFSTSADLPTGNARVARLHLRVPAGWDGQFTAKLAAAADASGRAIEGAAVVVKPGNPSGASTQPTEGTSR